MAMAMQSDENSRYTDLIDEPVDHLLSPIRGYEDKPLLSLTETVTTISAFFNGIKDYVYVALHNCQNPADGLNQQESASIYIYTMQFHGGPSLYLLLNQSLRAENREELKPWFSYLKLFLTALYKLPSQTGTVWRGVKNIDLSSKYKTGTKFAWWGVSSCTTEIQVLQSEKFLGKNGLRTLFSIDCFHGKSIANYSHFKNKEKEIILMPGSYFEVIGQLNPAPELYIIQLKEIAPPITLIEPPFPTTTNINPPSIVNQSNIIYQPTSSDIDSETMPMKANESPTSFRPQPKKRKIIVGIGLFIVLSLTVFIIFIIKTVIKNPVAKSTQKPEQPNSSIQIHLNTKWKQQGITISGGDGDGDQFNQLYYPYDIYVDHDQTIYIADSGNHRIVEWKCNEKKGQIVAGGKGQGNQNDQLNLPTDVIVDKQNDSIIICDQGNRRVMRWSRQNNTNGQIIISDIHCWSLTMDNNGYIYVSDVEKNEVRRWRIGDHSGTIVAGGNGEGDHLNQLNLPSYIFVDEDYSVYVSDSNNHRVMKWIKGAKEGIVVAGGNGQGNKLTQLSSPAGVIVDQLGHIYVAEWNNHRVMRWCKGAKQGTIVVGGNGEGQQSNQLYYPQGLSFDLQGNLYVIDQSNHRIQKFEIDLN